MDIALDQTLDSRNSNKQQESLDNESSNQLQQGESQQNQLDDYQFSRGNGQVTYRVVQVGGSQVNQEATLSIVSANGIPNILTQGTSAHDSPQMAIVSSSFNGSGENTELTTLAENQGSRFTYFPSINGTATDGQEISTHPDQEHAGQFYVMMSPQDMLQTTQSSKQQITPNNQFAIQKDQNRNTFVVRDSTRKVQHNEVERRRRDKINTWISKLSKMVPGCSDDQSKQGQSKGAILAKTCDYIVDLQNTGQQYAENLKQFNRMQHEYEVLKSQLEEKKQENLILHRTLHSHGIAVDIKSTTTN